MRGSPPHMQLGHTYFLHISDKIFINKSHDTLEFISLYINTIMIPQPYLDEKIRNKLLVLIETKRVQLLSNQLKCFTHIL